MHGAPPRTPAWAPRFASVAAALIPIVLIVTSPLVFSAAPARAQELPEVISEELGVTNAADDELEQTEDAEQPTDDALGAEGETLTDDASDEEPGDDESAMATQDAAEAIVDRPAPPAVADDERENDPFLNRLLDEINVRRRSLGVGPLAFLPRRANAAVDEFLGQTVPSIRWPGPCGHQQVGNAMSWDYVHAAGVGGEARGEVLACPGPDPYWTPGRTAEQWWTSPGHFPVVYADREANAIACSAYGTQGRGGRRGQSDTAIAVLCVTFRG